MDLLTSQKDRVAIMASGPSLTAEQVELVRASGVFTIAIGEAGRVSYPEADVLYHSEKTWWYHHFGVPNFKGKRVSIDKLTYSNIFALERSEQHKGIDLSFPKVVLGYNSGYQAINLAMYSKPLEIILLGFDMKNAPDGRHSVTGDHPKSIRRPSNFPLFIEAMNELAPILDNLGVKVYNCTLDTALTCFPKKDLKDAL